MQEIDYFKGAANEQFIDHYRLDLFSRMEITLYTYPNEMTEENPIPWEHFNRCEGILYEYLYNTYAEAKFQRYLEQKSQQADISDTHDHKADAEPAQMDQTPEQRAQGYKDEQEKRNAIVRAKMQELTPELIKLQDEYLEKVKLTFVDL